MKIRSYLSVLPFALTLVFSLLASTCARNPVTGKNELMLISENQEIAMGQSYHPQVLSEFGVYPDSTLQQFIRAKGAAMAKISHRPNLGWNFVIVDSPVVNAFAVPGGYVYFTRGIMAHFNNEAQFAGVLGHEIGHVTARHTAAQQSKQTLAQVGLIAGMVVSPELAQMGDAAMQGLQLLFLKFGRDAESQSDQLGVEYSTKIGYNSHEMADFFNTLKRLQDEAGVVIPTFLSTHPDPADRYNRVHQLSDEWQAKLNVQPATLEVDRDSYLKMIDGIVYGDDPRQGYFEEGFFYHPELKFKFPVPQGWQTQNTTSQVIMVTQDQKAGLLLQLGQGATPREAVEAAVQKFQLSVVESNQETVSNLPAFYAIGDLTDQQSQQVLRVLVYAIQYNGLIYQFLGFADKTTFGTYTPIFQRTTRGFSQLTDPAKLNVKPERISIRTVPRNMSFTEAMRNFSMPADRIEELAILNGMEKEQQVPQGTLIKIVAR